MREKILKIIMTLSHVKSDDLSRLRSCQLHLIILNVSPIKFHIRRLRSHRFEHSHSVFFLNNSLHASPASPHTHSETLAAIFYCDDWTPTRQHHQRSVGCVL